MLSHNTSPHKYTWDELKIDWFFRLLIKFLKKNLLYEQVAELYLTPLKNGNFSILSEAHSRNYYPEKMFFGMLTCTLPRMVEEGIVDEYGYYEYERKWSQFVWENRNVVPYEIREDIGFYHGGFKYWFLNEYEDRFGQDSFWERVKAAEDEYEE